MKITIENITTEYPKFKQIDLPKALKSEEYSFVKENLDLYNDDEDIKKYMNTFVLKLNEISAKQKKPAVKKVISKKGNSLKSTKPTNLTSFKKYLKENVGYTFDVIVNRKLTKTKDEKGTRRVELVQSTSVMFIDENGREVWLDYSKAGEWGFSDKYAKYFSDGFSIKFLYENKSSKVKKVSTETIKRKGNTKEHKAYRLIKQLFPDIEKIKNQENDLYIERKVKGYDRFIIESYFQEVAPGIIFDLAHYYTQNGDLMSAPRIQVAIDVKNQEVTPLTYESHNTFPQIYVEHYDWESERITKDGKYKDTIDFVLLWLKNLKEQGFGGCLFEEEKKNKPKSIVKKTLTKQKKATKKREVSTKNVGNVDLQITLIKSFVLMHGKQKTEANILNLYKKIEKAATELKIRKTSKYAKEIMYVSEFLKDSFNDRKFDVAIPTKKYNELYDIAYSEKQKDSVRLIKRYVGMYGLEENKQTEKRATNLLKALKSALSTKKITKSDMYFDKIKKIQANLEAYLLKSKNLHPNGIDLHGLAGIAGMIVPPEKKSLGGFESSNNLPAGIFSATEISTQVFDTVSLKDKWKQAIGTISLPFHLLFWGEKGSGKSTLLLNFAKYLTTEHNLSVLFIAKEEGRSFTLKEKINRLSAAVPNLYFSEQLPNDKAFLNQVDVLMIDSINSIGMSNDELEQLKLDFPNLSTVSLLMAYKNGDTYKGDSDFGHNAQAVFKVSDGSWKAEKNRFGGNEEVTIDF